MSRPLNIRRPVRLHTTLPEDIRAKLDLYLWSSVERRVPVGAYQRFILDRIREFFAAREPPVKKGLDRPLQEFLEDPFEDGK